MGIIVDIVVQREVVASRFYTYRSFIALIMPITSTIFSGGSVKCNFLIIIEVTEDTIKVYSFKGTIGE